jgi:hypothetical protein
MMLCRRKICVDGCTNTFFAFLPLRPSSHLLHLFTFGLLLVVNMLAKGRQMAGVLPSGKQDPKKLAIYMM